MTQPAEPSSSGGHRGTRGSLRDPDQPLARPKVRRIADDAQLCPECSQPLKSGGLVLAKRDDDGLRACRSVWRCADRHTWWQWADRPAEALEVCQVPELFR
ncbi:dehydrogenase [Streptomyces rubrogriseus]|uniref:Dehydrogenase n=1 Tax=Streptomyces rubrogriseus TaxID=194673 RepID=A0A6G3T9L8_9ACTN|nr:dehydrogenase [Streptomyces rubrogriseus]